MRPCEPNALRRAVGLRTRGTRFPFKGSRQAAVHTNGRGRGARGQGCTRWTGLLGPGGEDGARAQTHSQDCFLTSPSLPRGPSCHDRLQTPPSRGPRTSPSCVLGYLPAGSPWSRVRAGVWGGQGWRAAGSSSSRPSNNAQISACMSEGLSRGEAHGTLGRVRAQLCGLQNKKCWRPAPRLWTESVSPWTRLVKSPPL